MASNTNNGGGNHSPLSSSSSLVQNGSRPYQQNSGQTDHMDANSILTPLWFAAVLVAIFWLLCSRVDRTDTEAAAAGSRNDGDNTVRQRRGDEAAGGGVDGAPSSTVAGATAVQIAPPVPTAEAPLVCTYKKADGWPEGSCGVCLAELDDGEAVRVLPECMHYFHAACVGKWLRVHATCPLCRAPLVPRTSAAEDGKAVSSSS